MPLTFIRLSCQPSMYIYPTVYDYIFCTRIPLLKVYGVHSPHVTGQCWREGAFGHREVVSWATHVHDFVLLFPRSWNSSGLSTQQLVQRKGQASFTPSTYLHLHAVLFLSAHWQRLFFVVLSGNCTSNTVFESVHVGNGSGGNTVLLHNTWFGKFAQTELQKRRPSRCP